MSTLREKVEKAVTKLNKLGVFTLSDIDTRKDFDSTKMSRFDWMYDKVGESAHWVMNDVALTRYINPKNK